MLEREASNQSKAAEKAAAARAMLDRVHQKHAARQAAAAVPNAAHEARLAKISESRAKVVAASERRGRVKRKLTLTVSSHEDRAAAIRAKMDAEEVVARNCTANKIRFHWRVYRATHQRRQQEAAAVLQCRWRGGRQRARLRASLAAQLLQSAWRAYANRRAETCSELLLVAVVKLQQAYFRKKRERCELLYQLAVEAKSAAFERRDRMRQEEAAARLRAKEEAEARAAQAEAERVLAEEYREEREAAARERQRVLARRRRALRTAVRMITQFREAKEHARLQGLAERKAKRTIRKFMRLKMLRRLAAGSFLAERVSRVNKELALAQRSIQSALHAAEMQAEAPPPSRRRPGTTVSSRPTTGATAAEDWAWVGREATGWGSEGDDIIRSLHLRNALASEPPSTAGPSDPPQTAETAPAAAGVTAEDPDGRRALAEKLGALPSPRQRAVVALISSTAPESCVTVEGELTVDLAKIDVAGLAKIRAAIGAEQAANVWRKGGSPRRERHRKRQRRERFAAADSAASMRRTLRREWHVTHQGLNAPKVPARTSKSEGQSRARRRRRSRPATVTGAAERELPPLSVPLGMEVAARVYAERLSPLSHKRETPMGALISRAGIEQKTAEWITKQAIHQSDKIVAAGTNNRSPPPRAEVARRAESLGAGVWGGRKSRVETASSAQLHASREEERLLNDVRRSRAMQREMEEYVLRERDGVPT